MIPHTRDAITESIETTSAVLNVLTPPQLEQVRADINRELLDFIKTEWLPVKPGETIRNWVF